MDLQQQTLFVAAPPAAMGVLCADILRFGSRWVRLGRQVRDGERPYKSVRKRGTKAPPKVDDPELEQGEQDELVRPLHSTSWTCHACLAPLATPLPDCRPADS